MHFLAFMSSPRMNGSSAALMDAVAEGVCDQGSSIDKFYLHKMDITPCTGCGVCDHEFRCPIDDTFQELIAPLIECDGIIFVSPLYFMNVPARGKAFIDRCQMFWAAKYRMEKDLFEQRHRSGLLVSCGGACAGPHKTSLFRGIEDTMTYVFDALGCVMKESLLVYGIDNVEILLNRKDIIEKAHSVGQLIASQR